MIGRYRTAALIIGCQCVHQMFSPPLEYGHDQPTSEPLQWCSEIPEKLPWPSSGYCRGSDSMTGHKDWTVYHLHFASIYHHTISHLRWKKPEPVITKAEKFPIGFANCFQLASGLPRNWGCSYFPNLLHDKVVIRNLTYLTV